MANEIYTTSIFIQALPASFSPVCYALRQLPDTHFAYLERKTGKLIVLLEADSMHVIHDWINKAKNIEGVLSVAMVYQHVEQEASMNEVLA